MTTPKPHPATSLSSRDQLAPKDRQDQIVLALMNTYRMTSAQAQGTLNHALADHTQTLYDEMGSLTNPYKRLRRKWDEGLDAAMGLAFMRLMRLRFSAERGLAKTPKAKTVPMPRQHTAGDEGFRQWFATLPVQRPEVGPLPKPSEG